MGGDAIELVVQGVPGSGLESLARQVVRELGQILGTSIDVIFRAGNGGAEAMRYLAGHPGAAMLIATCTPRYLQLPLKAQVEVTVRQLTPPARLTADQYFIVVHADSPFADFSSLVGAAYSRPLQTAGYARGSINHILAHLIGKATCALYQFIVTPPELLPDSLRLGQADWVAATLLEFNRPLEQGAIRLLTTTGTRRLEAFPEIPTCRELGWTWSSFSGGV